MTGKGSDITIPLGDDHHMAGFPSVLNHRVEEYEVHRWTDGGSLPAVVEGTTENGDRFGIAADYPGRFYRHEAHEIDIVLTEEDDGGYVWTAFATVSSRFGGVNVSSDDARIVDTGDDVVERITTVIEEGDIPAVKVSRDIRLVVLESDEYGELKKRLGLRGYSTLEDRRERMERLVKPREERWADEDTKYVDMMRDFVEGS